MAARTKTPRSPEPFCSAVLNIVPLSPGRAFRLWLGNSPQPFPIVVRRCHPVPCDLAGTWGPILIGGFSQSSAFTFWAVSGSNEMATAFRPAEGGLPRRLTDHRFCARVALVSAFGVALCSPGRSAHGPDLAGRTAGDGGTARGNNRRRPCRANAAGAMGAPGSTDCHRSRCHAVVALACAGSLRREFTFPRVSCSIRPMNFGNQ